MNEKRAATFFGDGGTDGEVSTTTCETQCESHKAGYGRNGKEKIVKVGHQ